MAQTLPPIKKNTSGGGLLDFITKPADQAINAINNLYNNTLGVDLAGNPGTGKILPNTGDFKTDPLNSLMTVGALGLGGVEGIKSGDVKPEEAAADEGIATGSKIARDMRGKQGNFMSKTPTTQKAATQMPKIAVDSSVATQNGPQAAQTPSSTTNMSLPQINPAVEAPTQPQASAALTTPKGPGPRTYQPGNESQADILENQKRNLQYTDDIPHPGAKAQANATLNGYGIRGSMDDQLQGINDHKGILSRAAQAQVAADGGMTAKSDLLNGMIKDVSYNGSKHTIPQTEVANEATSYLNNVYVRATEGDPTKMFGDVMPDNVPDSTVQRMKSLMGQDAASTFGKDPSTWTKSQQIARYARNSFDTLLDQKHPQASILNNDMADLYNAEDSIRKGANVESTQAQKAANTPPEPPDTFGQKVGKFFKNPFVEAAIGTAAGGGALGLASQVAPTALVGAGAIIQKMTNPMNNQGDDYNANDLHNGGSLTQNYGSVKRNSNGDIPLPTQTTPSGQYYTYNDFLKDTTGMSPNSPQWGAKHLQYTDSKARAEEYFKGNNKQNFMDNAQGYINDAYDAKDSFSQVPPTLLNKLGSWQNVQTYIAQGGQYASQLQKLSQFNSEYKSAYQSATGVAPDNNQLLDPALPSRAFGQRWASMVDNMNKLYKQNLDPYLMLTSATTTQVPATGQVATPSYNRNPAGSSLSAPGMMQSNSQINGIPLPAIQ